MPALAPLPIDGVVDQIPSALGPGDAVVVEATPGAGKTTRVPAALCKEGQRVVVLEPRRLAARLAAARVASELGERLGEGVGYQVRFDSKVAPQTRLRFVTEGVLTRMLTADPTLAEFDTVIVDEIHERHLQGDLALALVDHLRRHDRRDMRLVAMSATLDGESLAAHLGATLVRCRERLHPVTVEHIPQPDADPLPTQVAKAVRRLVREGLDGHVLVFLPGAREIRLAAERCQAVARDAGLAVLPLHGSLPARAQDAAVAPSDRRKLVLATNIAESSITIEGVAAVIDSGLVKRARHEPWAVMPRLSLETISKASAEQRAGRAGRTRQGRCLRLYTEQEMFRWPDFDEPEIARSELSEAVLACRLAGADPSRLPWLTPPPEAAWEAAERLLGELGALDDAGITALGRRLASLPLPRGSPGRWSRRARAAWRRSPPRPSPSSPSAAISGRAAASETRLAPRSMVSWRPSSARRPRASTARWSKPSASIHVGRALAIARGGSCSGRRGGCREALPPTTATPPSSRSRSRSSRVSRIASPSAAAAREAWPCRAAVPRRSTTTRL